MVDCPSLTVSQKGRSPRRTSPIRLPDLIGDRDLGLPLRRNSTRGSCTSGSSSYARKQFTTQFNNVGHTEDVDSDRHILPPRLRYQSIEENGHQQALSESKIIKRWKTNEDDKDHLGYVARPSIKGGYRLAFLYHDKELREAVIPEEDRWNRIKDPMDDIGFDDTEATYYLPLPESMDAEIEAVDVDYGEIIENQ
ncbi:hypothetical protein Dimus_024762 [Dionaea muscipula]